ncbi:hypothetical protein C8J56DRAFT_920009 [Mycena floridula]|nr:hypothetical protein C8J56DRAFT_920009 [Mycena floridula]
MTQSLWWTTSGGSVFLPSGSETHPASTAISRSDSATTPNSGLTTFTTAIPVTTITEASTTITSFSQSVIVSSLSPSSTIPSFTSSGTAGSSFSTVTPIGKLDSGPVCIGQGLDSASEGLLASIILPSAIGLLIWLLFAVLRPRIRQVYALREWFVQQDLRPKPLSSSFFAFLFPHVPLVPSMPSDVSDAGQSPAEDSKLFPSDEQLNQRALWIALLMVLGWSILGLAGALPLYLVSLPCSAELPSSTFGGSFSVLSDLSLVRLLRAFDSGNVSTVNLIAIQRRDDTAGSDPQHLRIRIIILTVLAIVFALLPALWKILKEFNRSVAYRKRWLEVKCDNLEMGWLSAQHAPGFVGWGEKELKDFILKTGLSASLDKNSTSRNGRGHGDRNGSNEARRRTSEDQPLNPTETANLEVDVQTLFSIVDTEHIALLIDERDAILENLEIAETRYINSFKLSTPDPSIADFQPSPQDSTRLHISRPKALAGKSPRRKRSFNPAFASSSLAPIGFVAPSQYYKLRGVHGVSGGRFSESTYEVPEYPDTVNSQSGSRFQELTQPSSLPLGSRFTVDESGRLISTPSESSSFVPDPKLYGPNHGPFPTEDDKSGLEPLEEEEWVDVDKTPESEPNGPPPHSSSRRAMRQDPSSSTKRETFPFRKKAIVDPDDVVPPPPHLRVQPSQPFVRPLEGMNYDDLGLVYNDITRWRTNLKAINAAITDAQHDAYTDIAEGTRIKGWLMVGRGLHFIPGVQLIEGRAKEDIRWDVLQNERNITADFAFWTIMFLTAVLLAAGLSAAIGLALAAAPDEAHYLPFLHTLSDNNSLGAGIATILVPAVAALLFLALALYAVHWTANVRGSISISGGQLFIFKVTFFMLALVIAVLLAVGSLLFALHSFSTGASSTATSQSVAEGSIYMTVMALTIVIQVAIIFPGLLLLQPHRVWRVLRAERAAITPRQRFRALYPRTYDPSYSLGVCVLGIVFASTFALIFPLIGPAVVVLLFLTLIAHRFLVGYVFARTHSSTGGLLQIWILRRFGTLLSLQPILLGLIFLSQKFWIEGGILLGCGGIIILFVETYTHLKTRLPTRKSLSAITKDSLDTFNQTARPNGRHRTETQSPSLVSSGPARTRGSFASVLEMMSVTLAVMPSQSATRGAVPLETETLDDLTATERAARTHPDVVPPHLPPLSFTDRASVPFMPGILYAPELIAPPPVIWLPNDSAGVARSEAVDLSKYHDLSATISYRGPKDDFHLKPMESKRRS